MSDNFFEILAKEFCGDDDSLYEYKSGPKLINFFNANFGYEDEYYSGFQTRWRYVSDKIKDIEQRQLLNEFFSLIMSIEFHIQEKEITAVEAISFLELLNEHWNKKLRPYRYQLINVGKKYELIHLDKDLALIGSGGFADVYIQESTGLVLKKLKRENVVEKESRHRFKREYEITKSLEGISGIISVYEFNSSDFFYTMEQCDCTLQKFLLNNPINFKLKEYIVEEILKIMSEVHKEDIIHRDISANNIFLKENQIKIADFGLGKDFNQMHSHQTRNTGQIGQIDYCPPEQLRKLENTGKHSDVYSLGKLINFIFTNDSNDKNHKYKLLVDKATSLEPKYRYKDANNMYDAFKQIKKYIESEAQLGIVTNLIEDGKYNDSVEIYISSLSSKKLCENIINIKGFNHALIKYFESNNESILEILNFIEKDMDKSCKKFSDADGFAYIAYYILENNLGTYAVKEKASEILNHVAFYVNRFYAQGLIKSLLEKGIEPMLEGLLQKK